MLYSFFPKLDAEIHPSKPSDVQESLLLESFDCVLPFESIFIQEAPSSDYICVLGSSWGCFPQDSQGHCGALLL